MGKQVMQYVLVADIVGRSSHFAGYRKQYRYPCVPSVEKPVYSYLQTSAVIGLIASLTAIK